jgi:hypothetical protein
LHIHTFTYIADIPPAPQPTVSSKQQPVCVCVKGGGGGGYRLGTLVWGACKTRTKLKKPLPQSLLFTASPICNTHTHCSTRKRVVQETASETASESNVQNHRIATPQSMLTFDPHSKLMCAQTVLVLPPPFSVFLVLTIGSPWTTHSLSPWTDYSLTVSLDYSLAVSLDYSLTVSLDNSLVFLVLPFHV